MISHSISVPAQRRTRPGVTASTLAAAALAAVLITPAAHAQTIYEWQGGSDNWNLPANWLKSGPAASPVPDSADAEARHLTATTITLSDSRTIRGFQSTNTAGAFALSGGTLIGQGVVDSFMLVQGTTILNNGTLNNLTADLNNVTATSGGTVGFVDTALRFVGVANVSNSSFLYVRGSQTLGGTAAVNLSGGAQFGIEGDTTLTIGSSININGRGGTLGGSQRIVGGTRSLVNNGTLEADTNATSFTVGADNLGGSGVISARNGGTLNLSLSSSNNAQFTGILRSGDTSSGLVSTIALNGGNLVLGSTAGTGGTLRILDGSRFVLNNGATVTGGTILGEAADSFEGSLAVLNGGILSATAANLNNVYVEVGGTVGLVNAAVNINGSAYVADNAYLYARGNQTIGGTGSIELTAGSQFGIEGDTALTVGSGLNISGLNATLGGGQRLVGGTRTLVNNGLVRADTNGASLTVNVDNLSGSGTLEAVFGGTLNLSLSGANSGTFTGTVRSGDTLTSSISTVALNAGNLVLGSAPGTGGTIRVLNGSRFVLNGTGTVAGGTIIGDAGSKSVLNSGTLSGTSASLFDLSANSGGTVGFVNSSVSLFGSANIDNNSYLYVRGDQTLGGTAVVNISGNSQLGIEGNTTLTIDSGLKVSGANGRLGGGQRLVGGTRTLINNGSLIADTSGTSLTVAVDNLTNNGFIQAMNGGTLFLSGVVNNAGGTIWALDPNSQIVSNATTLTGGRIEGVGGGTFRQNNGTLSGVTATGDVLLNNVRIADGMILDGGLVRATDASSYINVRGNQTIGGSGTVLVAEGTQFGIEGDTRLTIGSGVTVRGGGSTLGGSQRIVGGSQSLENQGVITSTANLGDFVLDTDAPITNSGTLRAVAGSTLISTTGIMQNAGLTEANGTLSVRNGANQGTLSLAGGVVGGTGSLLADVVTTGGGEKTLTGGLVGTVGTLNITGGLSLDASSVFRLDVASLFSFDVLNVSGLTNLNNAILEINLLPGVDLEEGASLPNFMLSGGGFTGQFNPVIRANAGYVFTVDYNGSGAPVAARVVTAGSNAAVVPEAGTGLLALLAAAPAIGAACFRKRKNS